MLRRTARFAALGLLPLLAHAVPAPALPLPPCEDAEGNQTGACPTEHPDVGGSGVGRLSFNASIGVYVDPFVAPCYSWDPNVTGNWTPTPCYQAVEPIEVVGCAYVSASTGTFHEDANCARALLAPDSGPAGNLFRVGHGPQGSCGGEGAFNVYALGGPATQPDRIWSARGPTTTYCELSYLGPEPTGLHGATWVKLRATIGVHYGPGGRVWGTPRSTEFYVPIDGELRDLGPVAAFREGQNAGGRVRFVNDSRHTQGESMTYRWDFGDGQSSTDPSPEHRYREPGTYSITLVARDETGDEATARATVRVDFTLGVEVTLDPAVPKVEEPFTVTVTVTNAFDETVDRVALVGPEGLRLDPDYLVQNAGPNPEVPTTLAPGQSIAFTFEVEAIAAGRALLEGGAQGWIGGQNVSKTQDLLVYIPARLEVELKTSVTAATLVDDEFTVTATLTNADREPITEIRAEPLETRPLDIVAPVSGPTTADGADPRVAPVTLQPGESTTITWVYRATGKGPVDLRALISARDPHTDTVFFTSASKRIAIESGGLEVRDVRMSPGSPQPGSFGLIRGVVENIGSLDVTNTDVALVGMPTVQIVNRRLEELEANVSPRIERLAPGQTRDFVVPFGITTLADDGTKYGFELTMRGTVEVEGEPTEVTHSARGDGGLDLNDYWTTYLEELKRAFIDNTLEFFEGVNDWGERSGLGGSVVGGGQGVLDAFQKTGDGLLGAGELVVNTATGKYQLTEKGEQLAAAASEYFHTRTPKQMVNDLAEAVLVGEETLYGGANAVVDSFGRWLQQVDHAYATGDSREVARLFTESATTLAIAGTGEVAVERVGAKIFSNVFRRAEPRLPSVTDRAGGSPGERGAPDLPDAELRDLEINDIRDLPTGVNLSAGTVLKAGINERELGWMQKMAKEHGVAFFVRPRPAAAARFADQGFNAKPMLIKFKSINDIDVKWLGWDDYVGNEGLVVLREPKDPWPDLVDAMESGELKWGSPEVDAVVKRYNQRKAEWKATEAKLEELNAMNGGEGFDVLHRGEKVRTKVTLDADGLMRFSHNNQPVFSDIDLLHIARPDGKPIPKGLYDEIVGAAGEGFDMQHGATMATGDFDDWAQAQRFVNEYGGEHMRVTPSGQPGEPLIIVQPDVTTAGYVKDIQMPAEAAGSHGDLYGLVNVTFEGAGFP